MTRSRWKLLGDPLPWKYAPKLPQRFPWAKAWFCPRAGCVRSACPLRWAGCGNRIYGQDSKAPPIERGGNRYAWPVKLPRHILTLPVFQALPLIERTLDGDTGYTSHIWQSACWIFHWLQHQGVFQMTAIVKMIARLARKQSESGILSFSVRFSSSSTHVFSNSQ